MSGMKPIQATHFAPTDGRAFTPAWKHFWKPARPSDRTERVVTVVVVQLLKHRQSQLTFRPRCCNRVMRLRIDHHPGAN